MSREVERHGGQPEYRANEAEDQAWESALHWEGDLISGSKNSHMVILVERHSRFTTLIKVPSKDTALVVAGLSQQIRKLPATLRRSWTWDRGLEMATHKTFTVATGVKVFPWSAESLAARHEQKHKWATTIHP